MSVYQTAFDELFQALTGRAFNSEFDEQTEPTQEFKLDSNSKTRISQLHKELQPLAISLLEAAAAQGIALTITQGYRSHQAQNALYEQGRTTPGPVVTNAKPGVSKHNYGLAFDVAPLNEKGNPHWPNDQKLWDLIGKLGKDIGLRWGGEFKGFKDNPHFEHPNANNIINKSACNISYIKKQAESKKIEREINMLKLKLMSE